jgi:uncharacterized protein
MSSDPILQATFAFVRREFQHDSSGHDWWHIDRVWRTAGAIQAREGGDRRVVELAALLHDLDDWKLHPEADGTPVRAAAWLQEQGVDPDTLAQVCDIITHLSFKGAGVANGIRTLEGRIVQDADRLDAIGAIGVARAFAYGGHKGRLMHDPGEAPQLHATFEQYRQNVGTTVNHFHEKLLLLKDRMNTPTGRRMAEERHAFMVRYLEQFHREWEALLP